MTVKLNVIAANSRIVPLEGTFAAVVAFAEKYSAEKGPEVILGTLAAALATGTREFYSPVLRRGLRLNTAEEVFEKDLDAQRVRITPAAPDAPEPEVIVTGHAGTRALLADRWPEAVIIEGDVLEDDIAGKVVAGTLPPHLVALAGAYVPASVTDFDYSKDGDLAGDELRKRLTIGSPVTVTVE